jgi:hypothetical protein
MGRRGFPKLTGEERHRYANAMEAEIAEQRRIREAEEALRAQQSADAAQIYLRIAGTGLRALSHASRSQRRFLR